MSQNQQKSPSARDEAGFEVIEDGSLAGTVLQLLGEVRDLRDEVTHLRGKVKRLEHRSGRGIPHPSEVLAIDA